MNNEEVHNHLLNPANKICNLFNGIKCLPKPRIRFRDMVVEQTKVFDSSMRPIKLCFSNQDKNCSEDSVMLYKVGDDLRQDQLVMQFIEISDRIWLAESLDMQLVVYNCTYTSANTGVIEGIKEAENMGNVIRRFRTLAAIEPWLREKNPKIR